MSFSITVRGDSAAVISGRDDLAPDIASGGAPGPVLGLRPLIAPVVCNYRGISLDGRLGEKSILEICGPFLLQPFSLIVNNSY